MIEVAFAIGIMMIVATAGSFYLSGVRSDRQAFYLAEQLTTLFKAAQEKSASQENNSRWGVFVSNADPSSPYYALYQVNEDLLGEGGEGIPGTVTERKLLPNGVIFLAPASSEELNILFARGTGLPTEESLITIRSSAGSIEKSIFIKANGQIADSDPDA